MQVLSDLNGPIEVKKYHPKMFVLDVSTEMPNLSTKADKPIACSRLRDGGGSRSVIRNAKNARGLGRARAALPFFPPPSPPFPSRPRLTFALLVLIRSHYTI